MYLDKAKFAYELAKRNLTSCTVAKMAGITPATLSAIKNGKRCRGKTAERIAGALEMNVEELFS